MVEASFENAGGVLFAGTYALTYPVTFIDGPLPIIDAAWLFGMAAAYDRGRTAGSYLDSAIELTKTN